MLSSSRYPNGQVEQISQIKYKYLKLHSSFQLESIPGIRPRLLSLSNLLLQF
ncbi:hypothetical protein DCAR_0832484 [Daucus carota subsp. sativus]|uniref:Uncharacterized protein n=1 Tax=Daucus carota subsp. sativus TaxID=79200 RepID=A0A175YPG2_DAUCS|nr:hypothetical protein DCAR_0832484 [Daucus carota subsp. sativus]